MTFSLSTIKSPVMKNRKRVGRGNASGHGTYSTRGLKGQKSRSGVSGLKRLGMRKQILAVPKKRGFRSFKPQAQAVDFDAINKTFKDGAVITVKNLINAGLVKSAPVKILSRGTFKLKNVQFKGMSASKTALEIIKTLGGTVSAK